MATKMRLQLPKGLDVELIFVDPPAGAGAAPQADPQALQPVTPVDPNDPNVLGWNGCGCGGGNCVC
jgi:hypothetical protein